MKQAYSNSVGKLAVGVALALVVFAHMLVLTAADVFMHNPRGSNNRNCGDQNENRRNGNRLFNSQNNAKGGYSCPRSYPFPCYKLVDDPTARASCNQQNVPGAKGMVDKNGRIVNSAITFTDPSVNVAPTENGEMYYYEGSILPIHWTNQHGAGQNDELLSNIIIQYACEDTMPDLRDGYPVNNNNQGNVAGGVDKSLNGQATDTIVYDENDMARTNDAQNDYRYGRHEPLSYYRECRYRKRNGGLWLADRTSLSNSVGSIVTRQNPGGSRYGYECPEERDYWPYWHDSPWKDIANIVSDEKQCARGFSSQNVRSKRKCTDCPACSNVNGQPNNRQDCKEAGGKWKTVSSHGLEEPECVTGLRARPNHLGNIGNNGETPSFNWTIPELDKEDQRCVLRIRYNISVGDYNGVAQDGTAADTNKIMDDARTTTGEEASYIELGTNEKVAINVNADQWGRVFQDRSYTFRIKKRPFDLVGTKSTVIHNLNVRGKRGNIVQTFPAVEYDFVPNHLTCVQGEAVHVQWTGSDYNPNRNGNNGEGGPEDPTINGNTLRCDRTNMVEIAGPADNAPKGEILEEGILIRSTFFDRDQFTKMAELDQGSCLSIEELIIKYPQVNNNDKEQRERHWQNCGKLNQAASPYFDGGVYKCNALGTFHFMSTRNNNFSNRDMRMTINVIFDWKMFLIVLFSILGLIAAGLLYRRYKRKKQAALGKGAPVVAKVPLKERMGAAWNRFTGHSAMNNYVALYDYTAQEENELTFDKGDEISIVNRDPSGWWEGENVATGERGVFPATYISKK